MRVRDLLDVPGLGLRLLTDVSGADRAIRHVYTTDLPDPSRYLTPGDLVLTGMIWCREPGDADRFVRALVRAGAGVLGAGEALGEVPPEVIQACGRHGVALLAVPAETSFASVTEEVARRLNGDRATAMTKVLGRRRLLLSAVAEGAGLDAMFRLMGREIGAECWLLTGTGRVFGGTGASLPRPTAVRLACEYLKADRLPATARVSGPRVTEAGDGEVLPVRGGRRTEDHQLVPGRSGQEQDWAPELRESVVELAADVALERARLGAGRAGDRRLAEAIVTHAGVRGGRGRRPGRDRLADARGRIVGQKGTTWWPRCGRRPTGVSGPNAEHWRSDLAEELAGPDADSAVVAALGEQIIVLIPVPAGGGAEPGDAAPGDAAAAEGAPTTGTPAAHAFAARLRAAAPVLECDRARIRLTVGVSAPAEGVAALAGALHEAQSACRLAVIRAGSGAGAVSVVTSDEVASHELLLASVPGSVLRSFRDRLLGPLVAYDERHRAELLPTLREFLACSGSWHACAAAMYVHVNTVRYRIRRIEELTGRDLSSLADQVDFFLALRIG